MGKGSRYVRYDPITESYELRTPSSVVKWPQPVRERLIRDYVGVSKTIDDPRFAAYRVYMESGSWKLHGQSVSFRVTHLTKDRGRKVPLTFLVSDKQTMALLIDTPNAVMRTLVSYSYLTGVEIAGLPKLKLISKDLLHNVAEKRKSY